VDSDSDLMRDVSGGRTTALATLFERHHARLYRYCVRMTGDRHASEDLVQDVFMRILRYRDSFRDELGFVPWMFGIARNACLSHLSRSKLDRRGDQSLEDLPADAGPEDERAELVRRALGALPVERREVLLLSRYELKSYEEIAAVLGCSVGAVKVRAHRALKELRERYVALLQETSA
jgi:RNA polymerase sigma factor (sigma-70 family)